LASVIRFVTSHVSNTILGPYVDDRNLPDCPAFRRSFATSAVKYLLLPWLRYHRLKIAPIDLPFLLAAHAPNPERAHNVPLECGPRAFVDFHEVANQSPSSAADITPIATSCWMRSPVLNRMTDCTDRVDADQNGDTAARFFDVLPVS